MMAGVHADDGGDDDSPDNEMYWVGPDSALPLPPPTSASTSDAIAAKYMAARERAAPESESWRSSLASASNVTISLPFPPLFIYLLLHQLIN